MTEEEFNELRPSAFAIAYRMLGSVSEAEDVVQEGFLRLHRARAGGEPIESPRAYLSTVVARLSLDHLRSARVRRETYVGEWLPEPLVTSADDDPAHKAEMADSLSLAFLVLAREPVARPQFNTSREQREQLATHFFAAAEQGDLHGLEQLLAHDVQLTGDGGGKVPALARSLYGRNRVAPALIKAFRLIARLPGVSLRPVVVNGGPGAVFLDAQQRLIAVMALDTAGGQITSISSIVNPDKLAHLRPVADVSSLLGSAR